MADLKTNYVDDVLDASKNQLRKYNMIQNDDGTVSFVDTTTYTTTGTSFGAKDINDTNAKVNELNNSLGKIYTDTKIITKTIPAGEATTFIQFTNIPFGTYLVFVDVALSTQQPVGGALLNLNTVNGGVLKSFIEEIPSVSFLGYANVVGYAVISKEMDKIYATYFSTQSVTIANANLVAVRIK